MPRDESQPDSPSPLFLTPDPTPEPAPAEAMELPPRPRTRPGKAEAPLSSTTAGGPAPIDPSPDASSPRRSSGKPTSRKELEPVAAAGVATVTGIAHSLLTRDELERGAGLYLADPEDVDGMARPIAGLMSRRAPEGAASPDSADLLALGMALVGYVMKQWQLRRELAATRRAAAAGESSTTDHDPGTASPVPGPAGSSSPVDDSPAAAGGVSSLLARRGRQLGQLVDLSNEPA